MFFRYPRVFTEYLAYPDGTQLAIRKIRGFLTASKLYLKSNISDVFGGYAVNSKYNLLQNFYLRFWSIDADCGRIEPSSFFLWILPVNSLYFWIFNSLCFASMVVLDYISLVHSFYFMSQRVLNFSNVIMYFGQVA